MRGAVNSDIEFEVRGVHSPLCAASGRQAGGGRGSRGRQTAGCESASRGPTRGGAFRAGKQLLYQYSDLIES